MCGICGVLGEGNIQIFSEAIRHRGPDEEQFFLSPDIKLGVNRLEILDPEGGKQPFTKKHSPHLTAFLNGEIYNYSDLKKELEKSGVSFTTDSDVEVLFESFKKWGKSCLQRFNGMFALGVWDSNKKELFLARDRLGIKPLYYRKTTESFAFSSELKSFNKIFSCKVSLPSSLFTFETPFYEETPFKNIYQLQPGHYLTFKRGSLNIQKYWDIFDNSPSYKNYDEATQFLKFLLHDSLRLRTPKNLPFAVFLSGGIDSSFLALGARPDYLYTCHYPLGSKYNELSFSQRVASLIPNSKHLIISPKAKGFKSRLKQIVYSLDYPIATASSFSEFELCRQASSNRVKVILGGQGADELFGGYGRYQLISNFINNTTLHSENYRPLWEYLKSFPRKSTCHTYFTLMARNSSLENVPNFLPFFNNSRPLIDQMGICDLKLSLPSLLQMNDRAASSYGMENRTPFLDHRIVEFAFSIPPSWKIKDGVSKRILRDALKEDLPQEIYNRKDKKGLVTPVQRWIQGPLAKWANKNLNLLKDWGIPLRNDPRQSLRGEFSRHEYHHLCLSLWLQEFG